jgi:hypothetical protein
MNPLQKTPRRAFIKWSWIAAGLLLLSPVVHTYEDTVPETTYRGMLFHGTHDGKILASADNGQTWQKWMDFGSHNRVIQLGVSKSILIAVLRTGIDEFQAFSSDGRLWRV